jgi:uncharacterized protein YpuA (DUF1002 family)
MKRKAILVVFASVVVCAVVLGWLWVGIGLAAAATTKVVTLGADLTAAQRQQMFSTFGVKESDVRVLQVTNAQEREYLQGLVPDAQLGTHALSSVFVRPTKTGAGLKVQTKNITYVTAETYANALVTAGVKDADIYAAAPIPVSGTAALTGIFLAFESATGKTVSAEQKQVATEELAATAKTGQEVGNPAKVAELVKRVKVEIAKQGLTDPAAIRALVVSVSAQLGLTLTAAQIDQLTQVLVQVSKLNLDLGSIQQQLTNFSDKIGAVSEQAHGFFGRIRAIVQSAVDFVTKTWSSIFG